MKRLMQNPHVLYAEPNYIITDDLLYSILRIRGMECVSTTNYAEAFYFRKFIYE